MSPDVQILLSKILKFRDERDWAQFHTLKNLAAALSVEAAELLELTQWKTDKELDAVLANTEAKQAFSKEAADIFIYLLLICEKLKIDPVAVAEHKIIENAAKYPVEKSKGTAKKYSDL